MPVYRPLEERFWEKVDKTASCWLWTAATARRGGGRHVKPQVYGKISGERGESPRIWLAHRLSWVLEHGPIPSGMQVDHRCHNTLCVNPDHLRLATPKQNSENREGLASHNSTGYRGVQKIGNRFYAYCTHHGRRHSFGSFLTPEDAAEAAKRGRLSLMTHNDLDRVGAARSWD